MSDSLTIYSETKTLKPIERLRLVEMLLADLDQPDAHIDELWATVAQQRWEAYQSGKIATNTQEEVMAKYRTRSFNRSHAPAAMALG